MMVRQRERERVQARILALTLLGVEEGNHRSRFIDGSFLSSATVGRYGAPTGEGGTRYLAAFVDEANLDERFGQSYSSDHHHQLSYAFIVVIMISMI